MQLRTDQRKRLPLVAAIDAEVGVEGEDRDFGPEFRHADEAGVGEGHGDAGVADHEFVQQRVMVAHAEGQFQAPVGQPAFDAVFRLGDVLREKVNLGQDGFAGQHFGRQPAAFAHRPRVIPVITIENGDERAGVGDDALHRP